MGGLHVYAVLCQLLNPEICIEYEIIPDDFSAVASIGYCMKGGAIFAMEHERMVVGGIEYINKGVHCKGNPPSREELGAYLRAEREKRERLAPQIR